LISCDMGVTYQRVLIILVHLEILFDLLDLG
jgi:hypothetical protein